MYGELGERDVCGLAGHGQWCEQPVTGIAGICLRRQRQLYLADRGQHTLQLLERHQQQPPAEHHGPDGEDLYL